MTENSRNKFNKAGTYRCIICGKLTRNVDGESDLELCKACYDECERENAEADGIELPLDNKINRV